MGPNPMSAKHCGALYIGLVRLQSRNAVTCTCDVLCRGEYRLTSSAAMNSDSGRVVHLERVLGQALVSEVRELGSVDFPV